jgi:hypothetical protein
MLKFTIAFVLGNKACPYGNPMTAIADDSTSRATGDYISTTAASFNATLGEDVECHTLLVVDAGDHFSSAICDASKTMVWASVIRATAIPNDLRGAPDSLLVCRRIINYLDDDDEVPACDFAILLSHDHLFRMLGEEIHNPKVALYDCEHPQYLAMMIIDAAAPASGDYANRKRKIEYDFGIRRWLAGTGCRRDLVRTSLVAKRGGEAYMRMRAPIYLNAANGRTSIAKQVTMFLPQLDEVADVLCCQNTPSVISIGERCVGGVSGFYWPPRSQNPFFIKPDGAKVIVEVEGDIPYVANGRVEASVGEEDASGVFEVGTFGPIRLRDRSGAFIRQLVGDFISQDDVRAYVNIDGVRDETLRDEAVAAPPDDVGDHVSEMGEFEALSPVNDSECAGGHISEKDRRAYLYACDFDPVCFRDFTDAIPVVLYLLFLSSVI